MNHNLIPSCLPAAFRYVCCDGEKRPYTRKWQDNGLTLKQVKEVSDRRFKALGVLCGPVSGGLLILDIDGPRGWELLEQYSGNKIAPITTTCVGSEGSAKMLFWVPQKYWDRIRTVKDLTKADGHDQGIEILWTGRQGIIAGEHPTDGQYSYWPEADFESLQPQFAPDWLINLATPVDHTRNDYGDREQYINSLLAALPPRYADDYEDWITVGMALHSEGPHCLQLWDSFSRQSDKYDRKSLGQHWRSFGNTNGKLITIGTLHALAVKHGWKPDVSTGNGGDTNRETGQNQDRARDRGSSGTCHQDFSVVSEIEKKLFEEIQKRRQPVFPYETLPGKLGEQILFDAQLKCTDPVNYIQYLLPAIASRMGICELDLGQFSVVNVLWTMTVQESGGGKSRAYNAITKELNRLQSAEFLSFKEKLKGWKTRIANWKKQKPDDRGQEPEKPQLKQFLFDKATIEAVTRKISQLEDEASLWCRDELAGLFNSIGQYKKNKDSEGLDILIESWNGGSVNVSRVDDESSYFSENSRLNIAGGIQPDIFPKIFNQDLGAKGVQARFLISCPIEVTQRRILGNSSLDKILTDLFQYLKYQFSEETLYLHVDADREYGAFYDWVGEQIRSCENPLYKSWLNKYSNQVARLAMVFHCIDCWDTKVAFSSPISLSTLQKAIKVGEYYRETFLWLTGSNSEEQVPGILHRICDMALHSPNNEVSARDIYRSLRRTIAPLAASEGQKLSDFTIGLLEELELLKCGSIKKTERGSIIFKYSETGCQVTEDPQGLTGYNFRCVNSNVTPPGTGRQQQQDLEAEDEFDTKNTHGAVKQSVHRQQPQEGASTEGGLDSGAGSDTGSERGAGSQQTTSDVGVDAVVGGYKSGHDVDSELPSEPREKVQQSEDCEDAEADEFIVVNGVQLSLDEDDGEQDPHEDYSSFGDYWN